MNKKQKYFLLKLLVVFSVTAVTVAAVSSFKDFINKSESLLAMENLGALINQYRNQHGTLPPENYIDDIKTKLRGAPRMGKLVYRAKWLDYTTTSETILAYSKKDYSGIILSSGYVVLKYNGEVQWLTEDEFQLTMALQWAQGEPREE